MTTSSTLKNCTLSGSQTVLSAWRGQFITKFQQRVTSAGRRPNATCWVSGHHVQSWGGCGCAPDCSFLQRIRESRNILSWKGPINIIKTNSLLLAGLLKTKPYSTPLLYYFRRRAAVIGTHWETASRGEKAWCSKSALQEAAAPTLTEVS